MLWDIRGVWRELCLERTRKPYYGSSEIQWRTLVTRGCLFFHGPPNIGKTMVVNIISCLASSNVVVTLESRFLAGNAKAVRNYRNSFDEARSFFNNSNMTENIPIWHQIGLMIDFKK